MVCRRAVVVSLIACVGLCSVAVAQATAPNTKPAPQTAPATKKLEPKAITPAKPVAPATAPAVQPAGAPDMAAMMAAMEAAGKPGEHHKHLEAMAGEWDATMKMRMTPDMPWMEMKGTMSSKMEFDGRFIVGKFKGDMMGQPFEGISSTGYDNTTKQYQGYWMDSMSTAASWSLGTCEGGKVFTFTSERGDPMHAGKMMKMKEVITIKDANTHSMQFFEPDASGKPFESMVITYTRQGTKSGTDAAKPAVKDVKDAAKPK